MEEEDITVEELILRKLDELLEFKAQILAAVEEVKKAGPMALFTAMKG